MALRRARTAQGPLLSDLLVTSVRTSGGSDSECRVSWARGMVAVPCRLAVLLGRRGVRTCRKKTQHSGMGGESYEADSAAPAAGQKAEVRGFLVSPLEDTSERTDGTVGDGEGEGRK